MSEDENIQEPSVDRQSGSTEPAISTKETENIHSETKDMEIHHHPHVHHKKKWTDYLFEFLMLFLAVSLGFFVENQREHYIEHHRSEQYATFLHGDLINDTVVLSARTLFMNIAVKKMDTLIQLLQNFHDNDSTVSSIYDLSGYAYSGVFFSATTSTMEQLKSSGSLRYFRNPELISNFSQYDTDLQRLDAVEQRNVYLNEETRKFLVQFLDVKNISRITVNTFDSAGFAQPTISEPLRLYRKERQQLQQYANLCALKQHDWSTRIGLQNRVLHTAGELIKSLKKEYDLD